MTLIEDLRLRAAAYRAQLSDVVARVEAEARRLELLADYAALGHRAGKQPQTQTRKEGGAS